MITRRRRGENMNFVRSLCAGLAVAGLVIASALAFAAQPTELASELANYVGPDREQRLLAGARKEGEVNLYTSMVVEDVSNLAAAFETKYGIKLKYWRASSENVMQRLANEFRARRYEVDVIETDGPELESMVRENFLLRAPWSHDADLVPAALRPHRAWVGPRLNMFVQAYNT